VGHMWQTYRFYIEEIVKISPHLTLRSSVTNLGPPQRERSGGEGTRAQEEKEPGHRKRGEHAREEREPGAETMEPEAEGGDGPRGATRRRLQSGR
jgi:hypothetical protein